uniref:Uncharacterized protein n=1 Tax=Rhizophora mucronata TaxID=61149 RepID=A0A2P2NQH7_RHIMU
MMNHNIWFCILPSRWAHHCCCHANTGITLHNWRCKLHAHVVSQFL